VIVTLGRYDPVMARSRAVVVVTVLTAASALGWWFGDQRRTADQEYRVVQVLDGDTIVVQRGTYRDTIRLLGVDTPETHHPRKPVQCYGPEASAYTTARLEGQLVRLEDDVERHDVYGRRLAYVYFHGDNFEEELLRKGYGRLLVIEPNHAHARAMLDDELAARRRGAGLWSACAGSP
jgi:micrococcal nuclease